jgi:subtilisin family serine protease
MDCFVPGRVLVGPRTPEWELPSFAARLRDELRTEFELEFSIGDILRHYHLEPPKGPLPFVARVLEGEEENIAARLRGIDQVGAATPDYLVRPSGPATPLVIDDKVIDQAISDLGAQPSSTKCGKGCVVGILDSGIEPALLHKANINPQQYDAEMPAARNAPFDANGHGTLVARIISRIAPAATLLSVRTFDRTGTISGVIAALYLADAAGPCDVLNLSLSISCSPVPCKNCHRPAPAAANISQLSYFFDKFVGSASSTVLVSAAGNDVKDVSIPAKFDKIIAVGSFDYSAQSPISGYKSVPVDRFLLAPGGRGLSGEAFGKHTAFGQSGYMYGTSFATAFVTGFVTRMVCTYKNSSRHSALTKSTHAHGSGLLSFVLGEIVAKANTKWPKFHRTRHGLGALQF